MLLKWCVFVSKQFLSGNLRDNVKFSNRNVLMIEMCAGVCWQKIVVEIFMQELVGCVVLL